MGVKRQFGIVLAQGIPVLVPKPNQVRFPLIGNLISNLVSLLLIGGTIAFFLMLFVGGIQWMTSGGDKAGTEAAKGRITTALIGLLVLFSTWALILLIQKFFSVTILGGSLDIPTILNPNPVSP